MLNHKLTLTHTTKGRIMVFFVGCIFLRLSLILLVIRTTYVTTYIRCSMIIFYHFIPVEINTFSLGSTNGDVFSEIYNNIALCMTSGNGGSWDVGLNFEIKSNTKILTLSWTFLRLKIKKKCLISFSEVRGLFFCVLKPSPRCH